MKEAIRARCPLCGGEIIVSEYYQTSRDYKVLMNGKLSKRYIVTDAGPINSMTASCGSFCGAYWEHEEFDISEDGMFYDADCENYQPSGNYMEPPTCAVNGCTLYEAPQSWCYVEERRDSE